ncbi:MAG: LysR family transcriptional regulator [Pseudomonadota bacterium]
MDMLEQIRTLIAVADCGSFTKAGDKIGKSKALVSKHVSDLEDRLQARLFNRTTRKVHLTDSGAAFVERARSLLGEVDDLVLAVQSDVSTARGRLKITAPQAFGELEFMELLGGFRERYPDIEPEVFLSDRVVDVVGEGFDVALRVTSLVDSTLITRKLCEIPLRLCASRAFLREHGEPLEPADLPAFPCIVDTNMRQPDAWKFDIPELGETQVVRVPSVLRINSAVACRKAALAGHGIVLSPEFVVGADLNSGALVELFGNRVASDLMLHVLYPHRQHLSTKTRAFVDFAVAWYANERPWQRRKSKPDDGPTTHAVAIANHASKRAGPSLHP